jgi:hypothetical protein
MDAHVGGLELLREVGHLTGLIADWNRESRVHRLGSLTGAQHAQISSMRRQEMTTRS